MFDSHAQSLVPLPRLILMIVGAWVIQVPSVRGFDSDSNGARTKPYALEIVRVKYYFCHNVPLSISFHEHFYYYDEQ